MDTKVIIAIVILVLVLVGVGIMFFISKKEESSPTPSDSNEVSTRGYSPSPVPGNEPQGYSPSPAPGNEPQGYSPSPAPGNEPQGYSPSPAPGVAAPAPISMPVVSISPTSITPTPSTNTALRQTNYYEFDGTSSKKIHFTKIPFTPTSTGITFVIKFRFTGTTSTDYESLLCINKDDLDSTSRYNANQGDANTMFIGRGPASQSSVLEHVFISFTGNSSTNAAGIISGPSTGPLTRGVDYILAVRWTGSTTTAGPAYTLSRWLTTGSSLGGVAKIDSLLGNTKSPVDGTYDLMAIGHQNQQKAIDGYGFMNGRIYYMYVYNQALTDSEIEQF